MPKLMRLEAEGGRLGVVVQTSLETIIVCPHDC